MGREQKPPPQFGQTLSSTFSTQERQNVHSNEQIIASVESGGRAVLQFSHVGLSSSIMPSVLPANRAAYASSFMPWKRVGPDVALDGRPKFDLMRLDQAYFDRLRSRVLAAGERGLYVSIMLFEGHALRFSKAPWRWDGHPFNKSNNLNAIDGDSNSDGMGLEV